LNVSLGPVLAPASASPARQRGLAQTPRVPERGSRSPRAAGSDVGGLRADGADPLLHRFGKELRAIVGADVPGNSSQDEQIRQRVDDVDRVEPSGYPNGQAFVGELVDDVEQADLASVMGALLEKVIEPALAKAGDQTWLGRSARSRMHDPSASHSRARLGCRLGTFSPSRRQIRSTRLSLTSQPARRNSSAILR
jgi:hypothetical protein